MRGNGQEASREEILRYTLYNYFLLIIYYALYTLSLCSAIVIASLYYDDVTANVVYLLTRVRSLVRNLSLKQRKPPSDSNARINVSVFIATRRMGN